MDQDNSDIQSIETSAVEAIPEQASTTQDTDRILVLAGNKYLIVSSDPASNLFNIVKGEIIADDNRKIYCSWYDPDTDSIYYVTAVKNNEKRNIYRKAFANLADDEMGSIVCKITYNALLPIGHRLFYRQDGLIIEQLFIDVKSLTDETCSDSNKGYCTGTKTDVITTSKSLVTMQRNVSLFVPSVDQSWFIMTTGKYVKLVHVSDGTCYLCNVKKSVKIVNFDVVRRDSDTSQQEYNFNTSNEQESSENICIFGICSVRHKLFKFELEFEDGAQFRISEEQVFDDFTNFCYNDLVYRLPNERGLFTVSDTHYVKVLPDTIEIIETKTKRECLVTKHDFTATNIKFFRLAN